MMFCVKSGFLSLLTLFQYENAMKCTQRFCFYGKLVIVYYFHSIALYQLNRSQERYTESHIAVVTNHNILSKILLNFLLIHVSYEETFFPTPICIASYILLLSRHIFNSNTENCIFNVDV